VTSYCTKGPEAFLILQYMYLFNLEISCHVYLERSWWHDKQWKISFGIKSGLAQYIYHAIGPALDKHVLQTPEKEKEKPGAQRL
jgi:hypothetical protein